MVRNRTARKTSELNAKAVIELTNVTRTDELITEVCKKHKVKENQIRNILGCKKR